MPAAKPQGTAQAVGKTSLAKQPDPVMVFRGRLKAAEPSACGRARDAADAPQVCSLSDGQWRWGVIAALRGREGRVTSSEVRSGRL